MTYKRIIQITDTDRATTIAISADRYGLTFRRARSGGANEYVIEGATSNRRLIDAVACAGEGR